MIRQVVILSAGMGTRLQPVTNTIPKVMIPILGKPLLEWHIEQFRKHGMTEVFVNTHYLPEVIKNHFGNGSKWDVRIHYSFEPVILGTAGGMKSFEDRLDDTFFVIYGDTFSLIDYTKMAEVWKKLPKDAIGMQHMKKTDDYTDADIAELDADGKYITIHARPHTKQYANAYRMRGVFILQKRILSYIPPHTFYEIGSQLLPNVIDCGMKFYGYECNEYSNEYSKGIDTVEKWKEVEDYLTKCQGEK